MSDTSITVGTTVQSSSGSAPRLAQSSSTVYAADSVATQTLLLAPNQYWDGAASSITTVSTSGPVFMEFLPVGATDTQTVNITSVLTLDQAVSSFKIMNNGTGTVTVRVTFGFSSQNPVPAIPGRVTDVNGKQGSVKIVGGSGIVVDNSGSNVVINNVGIQTVSGQHPYTVPFIFNKSGLSRTISGSFGSGNQTLVNVGTVPAGMLLSNGSIELDIWATTTNNANAKSFMIQLGGVTVGTFSLSGSDTFRLLFAIQNANAQNSQIISGNTVTAVGNSSVSLNTANVDMTQAQTLTLVGALPTSTDSMTLVRYDATIRNYA